MHLNDISLGFLALEGECAGVPAKNYHNKDGWSGPCFSEDDNFVAKRRFEDLFTVGESRVTIWGICVDVNQPRFKINVVLYLDGLYRLKDVFESSATNDTEQIRSTHLRYLTNEVHEFLDKILGGVELRKKCEYYAWTPVSIFPDNGGSPASTGAEDDC